MTDRNRLALIALAALLPLMTSIGCSEDGGGGPPDADLRPDAPPPEGTVTMQWSIEQGGVSTNCEAVGALAVSFRATQPDASITEIDSFLCGSGTASRVLEADTWDIELLLIGSGSVTLDGPLRTDDVVVTAGGDTDIGLIVFTVE